jgi:hypothetical protein
MKELLYINKIIFKKYFKEWYQFISLILILSDDIKISL